MKMKKTLQLILALASISSASAVTIVEWGPASDIVNGHVDLTANSGSTVLDYGAGYSSPTQGPGYYPNAATEGATPNFYGAAYAEDNGTPATGAFWRILNSFSGGNDQLAVNATLTESYQLFIWTQNEFEGGGDSAPTVQLDTLSINYSRNSSGIAAEGRFVVQLGDNNYYISESGATRTANNFSWENVDPTTIAWFNYNPVSGGDIRTIGSSATLSASDFDDVIGVGMYLSGTGSSGTHQMRVTDFGVTATIPEPSTYALVGGALAMLTGMLRRRRR